MLWDPALKSCRILSLSKCPRGGNIGVGGVAPTIKGAHAIPVTRVARKSGVGVSRYVWSYLIDLHKSGAVITLTTFDLEAALIIRIISPRQIDLTG